MCKYVKVKLIGKIKFYVIPSQYSPSSDIEKNKLKRVSDRNKIKYKITLSKQPINDYCNTVAVVRRELN